MVMKLFFKFIRIFYHAGDIPTRVLAKQNFESITDFFLAIGDEYVHVILNGCEDS